MLYITSVKAGVRKGDAKASEPAGRLADPRWESTEVVVESLARERARRWLNVIVALVALIACLPLMVVIGLLVKLTSPGPMLHVQTRVGIDRRNGTRPTFRHRRRVDFGGRPFKMYKFRTMHVNGGKPAQVWAQPNDPRVTPIGRFLRKYRLDELPQLINVLKDDMNIVGPRPEQPLIFLDLRTKIDGYQDRQRVAPGITGWAQVNQHYDRSVDDVRRKLDFDLEYIGRRSWTEDLKIMLRTIPVVLLRRGAW